MSVALVESVCRHPNSEPEGPKGVDQPAEHERGG
jgi:hypothetical protein